MPGRRRTIWILIVVICLLVFILAIFIFTKPIILSLVKGKLGKVFPDSGISIDDCRIRHLNLLILSDINIEKESVYGFKIKEIRISFSLLKRVIQRVCMKDVSITIDIPEENILEFNQYLNLAEPHRRKGNWVNTVELQDVNISLDTKNFGKKDKRVVIVKADRKEQWEMERRIRVNWTLLILGYVGAIFPIVVNAASVKNDIRCNMRQAAVN